jgi:putative oxidoreductase
MKKTFKSMYAQLIQAENALKHPFLLLIRLYWGWLFFVVGLGKLIDADTVSGFFAQANIPLPLFTAYLVGIIECLGGISLFLGLYTRIMTIPLVIVMIGAYILAHPIALADIVQSPNVITTQPPFLYLLATLTVMCFGSGMFSLDYWLSKKSK